MIEHLEQHFDVGGRELVTRVALDEHPVGRREAAARLVQALSVPDQADVLLSGPTNRVGEVLYVCVLPSDRLGWIAAQLDPAGERATLAVAVGDELLLTFRTSTVADGPVETRDTVADLMRTQPIVAPLTVPIAV